MEDKKLETQIPQNEFEGNREVDVAEALNCEYFIKAAASVDLISCSSCFYGHRRNGRYVCTKSKKPR